MSSFQISALSFVQNGKTMYQVNLSAGKLLKIAKIDEWDPDLPMDKISDLSKQGYQRKPIKSHLEKVARYLNQEDAILPTGILLSARKALKFYPEDEDGEGLLTIEPPLYIVDGQHRLYGLKHAIEEGQKDELRNFVLPVVIMSKVPKVQEVSQFRTVNVTQKKVRSDLADRLLAQIAESNPDVKQELVSKNRQWKLRGIKICDAINEEASGPWYHRIRRPNALRTDVTVASEGSFVSSLKPILRSGDTFEELTDEQITNFLIDYWVAMKELMPEAFESPRDYVIQKTTGMYVLHQVLPKVYRQCLIQRSYSKTSIKKILSKDETHFKASYWASSVGEAADYIGMGPFATLADEIKENLG